LLGKILDSQKISEIKSEKIIKHIGYKTWNTSPRKRPTNPNQQSLYRIQSNRKKEKERKKQIKKKELSFTGGLNTRAKIVEVGDRVFSSVEVVSQLLSHSLFALCLLVCNNALKNKLFFRSTAILLVFLTI